MGCKSNTRMLFESYSVVLVHNVTWLCAVGDFENGTFNLPPKLNSSSNAQLTTSAPITQNQCYAYVAVNLG